MMWRRPLRPALLSLTLCVAGGAWADGIELTGEVSMGLGGGTDPTRASSLRMITDLDLQMRLSRTTDSGLTFALEFDLDDLEPEETTLSPGIPRRR
jgi:hypothetical protein